MSDDRMSRVWLITGASRGLGAAIAKVALAAGDLVVATGRNREQIAQAFARDGHRVLALTLDVTDEAQALRAVDATMSRFGRIDVLVNAAGYGLLGMFEENTPGAIERQFATNVFGLMHVTRAVLPVMRRQRSGRIFNLTSVAGLVGSAGGSIYSSTKFAVEGFSESLAQELAPFGIQVTLVEPGFFRTDFLDAGSMQYGSKCIEDYAASSAAIRAALGERNHRQPGDPVKLGVAIVMLASTEHPPLHWVAGRDAVVLAGDKIATLRAELERWRGLSLSTDLESEVAAA